MNCHDCLDLLQRRLDGDFAGPVRALDEHLQSCGSCRETEAGFKLLTSSPRCIPLPSRDLSHSIVARVMTDQRRSRDQHVHLRRVSAIAAGLLLVVLGGLAWQSSSVPEQPVVVADPLPPTLKESAGQLGENVAAIWNRTANEAAIDRFVVLPALPAVPATEKISFEEPTRALRETSQGLSTGLEPVTNSAKRAWNLFSDMTSMQ